MKTNRNNKKAISFYTYGLAFSEEEVFAISTLHIKQKHSKKMDDCILDWHLPLLVHFLMLVHCPFLFSQYCYKILVTINWWFRLELSIKDSNYSINTIG